MRKEKADEIVADIIYANGHPDHEIHLPAPSYFPFFVGLGIMLIAYGIIYHTRPWGIPLLVAGAVVTIAAFVAWGSEPLEEIHEGHGDDESDHDGDPLEPLAGSAMSKGDG